MIAHGYKALCIAALCAMFFAADRALAESANDLVKKGNQAFRNGDYDGAQSAYEKASVESPESPHIYFNKGTAQYRKGNYRDAASLFEQAAVKTRDLRLEARSWYNRGNCLFRESERQRDSDLRKSLEALKDAIACYQQALKLDSAWEDAAHNIEVSRLVMKQILDEIKKQQDEAKKAQQEQQKQADKLKNLIAQQEDIAARTRALGEKRPSDLLDQARKLGEEQKAVKSGTEDLADRLASSQENTEAAAKAGEHLRSAVECQSSAAQDLDLGRTNKAQPHQEQALEEMNKSLEQISGAAPGPAEQDKTDEPKPPQDGGAKPPEPQEDEQRPPPRDETAHDILDQEKQDRRRRDSSAAGGYMPVEKDW